MPAGSAARSSAIGSPAGAGEPDLTGRASLDQFGRAALGDDPAGVQHHHRVGQLLGLVQVVGAQHDADPVAAQPADQVPGAAPGLRVHAGGRLVEEQQLRTRDQRHRQRQPLLLAAGQPLDRRAGHLGQPHLRRAARRRPAGARRSCRTAAAVPGRGPRCSRRRRPAASPRPWDAARRRRGPGPARAPGPGRRRRAGSPRRSRWWWSCRRRWCPAAPAAGRAARSARCRPPPAGRHSA